MNGELIQLRQNEIYEYIKGRNLTTIQDLSLIHILDEKPGIGLRFPENRL